MNKWEKEFRSPDKKLVIRTWMMVVEKQKGITNLELIRKEEFENRQTEVVDRVDKLGSG